MSLPTRTIWFSADSPFIEIIDQRALPHQLVVATLRSCEDAIRAIRDMWVRGAPLIGATAACGLYLAAIEAGDRPDADSWLRLQCARMREARPTAINLRWAVERVEKAWQQGDRVA
ncbi:MAG: S-methyl-5-thioribose-1-phosphate isomerase, partial [Bacteroidetes bacterium]